MTSDKLSENETKKLEELDKILSENRIEEHVDGRDYRDVESVGDGQESAAKAGE